MPAPAQTAGTGGSPYLAGTAHDAGGRLIGGCGSASGVNGQGIRIHMPERARRTKSSAFK